MIDVIVLTLTLIVATLAFGWLANGVITALNWPVARLGSAVHKSLHLLPHNENEAWLFVLLLGVSRALLLGLATLTFAAALAVIMLPVPELFMTIRDVLMSFLLIVLVMRLAAIFFGALVIGGSVRMVLKSLKN